MSDSQQLTGGELNAAVTSALVGIHTKFLGRGPSNASTFHHDNVLVTLMHGVLTHAERMLSENGHGDSVDQMRHHFQATMEPALLSEVERLTGRKVRAFIGGNRIEPDLAALMFILDRPL